MGRKRESAKRHQQQQFISAHIYSAVCPSIGKTEVLISPVLSMEIMQKHLQLIADATPTGRYAIVIMDCASWHSNKTAIKFDSLTIIHLPLIRQSSIQSNKCGHV